MKILISGWYGYKNTGDELILDVFLEHCAEHEVTVLTQGVIDENRAPSLFHSDILRFDSGGIKQWLSGKPLKLLATLASIDCFVLGGGGILRESGNFTNLNRLLDEISLARLMRKKIFIYGVSIGPIASDRGKNMIISALKKCDFITVRDQESMLFLVQAGIPAHCRLLAPDPVYAIGNRAPTAIIEDTQAYIEVVKKRKIPLFLALGLIDDGNDLSSLDNLGSALDIICAQFDVSFVSIPFRKLQNDSIDDSYAARELKKRTSNPSTLTCIDEEYSSAQIENIVESAHFVISVRLHAMIVALARGTPFVAVNYDPKVRNTAILSNVNELVVECNENFSENFCRVFSSTYPQRNEWKTRLTAESLRLAKESNNVFTALDKLLQS